MQEVWHPWLREETSGRFQDDFGALHMAIAVCSGPMPAKPALEARATVVLGNPAAREYATATAIVTAATTLKQAVTDPDPAGPAGGTSFFLDGLPTAAQTEITGMLNRLPRHVDGGVLGELKTALQSGKRIAFQWQPHPNGPMFDHNAWTDHNDRNLVHIVLRTPPGGP